MANELKKQQEFEIFKMIFDKLLLIGTGIIIVGLYYLFLEQLTAGLIFIFSGLFLFIMFSAILIGHSEEKIQQKKKKE